MILIKTNKIFARFADQKGLTLLEIIVVIAILGIMMAVTAPSLQSLADNIALKDAVQLVKTKTKIAKDYSLGAKNDKKYGIRFETSKITLFLVNADDTTADVESYDLPSGVEIYGITLADSGQSIVFSRLTGASSTNGSFGVKTTANPSISKQVFINAQGQVSMGSFATSAEPPITDGRHIHFNLSSWTIQDSPLTVTDLIFKKSDGVTVVDDIAISSSFFSGGIFNWEGTITVDGVAQKLKIHTLDSGGAKVCVMRDRTENSKSIKIYFKHSGTDYEVATYIESGGTVTITPGFGVTANPQ